MSAGRFSRYLLCETLVDAQGRLFYGERSRYFYRELSDNIYHTVSEGDSIFTLAAQYYAGADRAALLYWVIADFQPTPINDVSVPLPVGYVLVIPSLRTVTEEILNPARTAEFRG